MGRRVPVLLKQNESGKYMAGVPLLPECTSEGNTKEEALANVKEAIELHIQRLKAEREDLPIWGEIIRESREGCCRGLTAKFRETPPGVEKVVIEVIV